MLTLNGLDLKAEISASCITECKLSYLCVNVDTILSVYYTKVFTKCIFGASHVVNCDNIR